MKRFGVTLLALTICLPGFAKTGRGEQLDRLQNAATVLKEIMAAPDSGVPQEILGSAQCVAVVPSMLKGGFVLGAQYGHGVATCRIAENSATWSAPTFFRIEGGSIGFQAGAQAVDLVMLVMNQRGMRALLSSRFKIGADASAAAGPVGRQAEGMTDWKMRAEVLTYSRARGIFAGISLNGAAVLTDDDAIREFYLRRVPTRTILMGRIATPKDGTIFTDTVSRYAAMASGKETPPQPAKK